MSDHDSSIVGVEHFFPARAQLTGLAKLRFDMAVSFTAPTRTHVRDLLELLKEEPADLLVGDTGLIAGHIVAELGGLPFAALGITVLGMPSRDLAPFGLGLWPSRNPLSRIRNAALHRLARGVLFRPMTETINQIRAEHGLAPTADLVFDYPMRGSVYLQLGAEGFEYPRSDLPGLRTLRRPDPAAERSALAAAGVVGRAGVGSPRDPGQPGHRRHGAA